MSEINDCILLNQKIIILEDTVKYSKAFHLKNYELYNSKILEWLSNNIEFDHQNIKVICKYKLSEFLYVHLIVFIKLIHIHIK